MKRPYGSPDDQRWFIPLLVVNVALIIIIILLMIALASVLFPILFGEGNSQEQSAVMYPKPPTLQYIIKPEIAITASDVESLSLQLFLPYIARNYAR